MKSVPRTACLVLVLRCLCPRSCNVGMAITCRCEATGGTTICHLVHKIGSAFVRPVAPNLQFAPTLVPEAKYSVCHVQHTWSLARVQPLGICAFVYSVPFDLPKSMGVPSTIKVRDALRQRLYGMCMNSKSRQVERDHSGIRQHL